jgi:hypothetical protein
MLGPLIYLGTATGEMRSFMERLIFPCLICDATIQRINLTIILNMSQHYSMLKRKRRKEEKNFQKTVKELLIWEFALRKFEDNNLYANGARCSLNQDKIRKQTITCRIHRWLGRSPPRKGDSMNSGKRSRKTDSHDLTESTSTEKKIDLLGHSRGMVE